jgi:hypothetical protein
VILTAGYKSIVLNVFFSFLSVRRSQTHRITQKDKQKTRFFPFVLASDKEYQVEANGGEEEYADQMWCPRC